MLSESVIQDVKASIDIVEVIHQIVPLRRRGNNFIGLCPFHSEKTPSFVVSPARQKFKCFGCGVTGDVFQFLQDNQGITFPEAVMHCAQSVGMTIESLNDPNQKWYDLMEEWNEDFRTCLTKNQMAMDYLTRRGITREEIQTFEIGFCPYRLPEQAGLFGYDDPEDLKRVGMITGKYLLFSARITFPIRNAHGKLVGFSGRAVADATGSHKYVNSALSDLYHKDRLLYGFKMARSMASLKDEMNLIEGYTDVMAMHRVRMTNSVACCGTAFTEHHAREIKKVCRRICFWFDGDAAGHKAAIRSVEIALGVGLNVTVKKLPAGEDVYSMVQAGRSLHEVPNVSISDLFINKKLTDQFEIADSIEKAVKIIASIPNPVVRDLQLKEICHNFGVSYRILSRQLHIHQKQQIL